MLGVRDAHLRAPECSVPPAPSTSTTEVASRPWKVWIVPTLSRTHAAASRENRSASGVSLARRLAATSRNGEMKNTSGSPAAPMRRRTAAAKSPSAGHHLPSCGPVRSNQADMRASSPLSGPAAWTICPS